MHRARTTLGPGPRSRACDLVQFFVEPSLEAFCVEPSGARPRTVATDGVQPATGISPPVCRTLPLRSITNQALRERPRLGSNTPYCPPIAPLGSASRL